MKIVLTGFDNKMTRTQQILGFIYLPLHIFVIPILLAIAANVIPGGVSDGTGNLIYYGLGFVFCLIFMFGFLRRSFDALLDNLAQAVIAMLLAYITYYFLNYLASAALLIIGGEGAFQNPNDDAVMTIMNAGGRGPMLAVSIFLAPIVEEVLFRGVLFGALHKKNRVLAYAVSILLFGVYHIWQFALTGPNWMLLAYIVQYIPISWALTLCYERSNSIWPPIFLHMINNALIVLGI